MTVTVVMGIIILRAIITIPTTEIRATVVTIHPHRLLPAEITAATILRLPLPVAEMVRVAAKAEIILPNHLAVAMAAVTAGGTTEAVTTLPNPLAAVTAVDMEDTVEVEILPILPVVAVMAVETVEVEILPILPILQAAAVTAVETVAEAILPTLPAVVPILRWNRTAKSTRSQIQPRLPIPSLSSKAAKRSKSPRGADLPRIRNSCHYKARRY